MKVLALVPQLRNAVLEWPREGREILYFSRRAETDPELERATPNVQRFSWRKVCAFARDPSVVAIEVGEPMWAREWPKCFGVVVFIKLVRRVRRLPRVVVATYAIENLGWEERFLLPQLDSRPAINLLFAKSARVIFDLSSRFVLDMIIFGSSGAQANYGVSMPRTMRGVRSSRLPTDWSRCACLRPMPVGTSNATPPRRRVVQFLGEAQRRKGIDVLLAAWGLVVQSHPGEDLSLVLTGPGCELIEPRATSIVVEHAVARGLIYRKLAAADVVVLPSRRVRRWREQQGLPIGEGIRHGCRIVTTTETGLAADLDGRSDVWIVPPESPTELAAAISAALSDPPPPRSCDETYAHADSTRAAIWSLMCGGS